MAAAGYGGSSDEEHASDRDDASSRGSSRSSVPTMQLSPLQIRFSQKKMRNVFGDGRLIEEAAAQVKAIRRSKEDAELYDAAFKLEAPFPPIEVLRWRCKLRDENTGRPLLNERGKEMFEQEESWFTLDNRRLWCLQKAALKLLPENCTADVIAEVRKDRRMREIRKFRTMDNGQSINVGSVVDGVPFEKWDWRAEHANPHRTTADRLVPPPANRKGGKGKKGKGATKGSDGKGGKGQIAQDGVPTAFAGPAAFEQFAAAFSAQACGKGGKGYKGPPAAACGWDYAGAGWGYGGYGGWDYSGYGGKGADYYGGWHADSGSKGRGKGGGGGGAGAKGGGGGGGKGGQSGGGGKNNRRGRGSGGGKAAQGAGEGE